MSNQLKTQEAEALDATVANELLYYNSRDTLCKEPFGAIVPGTEVSFTLRAKAKEFEAITLLVDKQTIVGNQDQISFTDQTGYPLQKSGTSKDGALEYWTVKVTFPDVAVYTYLFQAESAAGKVLYGNNSEIVGEPNNKVVGTGGIGEISFSETVNKYRQTVYDAAFKVPEWAADAVYYQIFPDRFKNGDPSNDPRPGSKFFIANAPVELHANWLEKPFTAVVDGSDDIWNNDFFGGDLEGIRQKLDYLKDLGVNTVYMTPIFQSPSNHRYDTADFMKIDEAMGTEDEFRRLMKEGKEKGIRFILDVSLNHSSADSVYMNRYGKYPTLGAFQNNQIQEESPYRDWYEFKEEWSDPDEAYLRWFVHTLPDLNDRSESYRDFAFRKPDSVMKYWLDQGLDGWRMDVAPWVSDDFWREWRAEIKRAYPDAMTVAETWFDSSKYFLGDMFDSTMNYIFRQAVLEFARGENTQHSLNALEMMRENYPEPAFHAVMNSVSTHDVARAYYELGYKDDDNADSLKLAKKRMRLAVFFQMTYPGAPSVYYGDEVGLPGGPDPMNRRTYPWKEDGGQLDEAMLADHKALIALRNEQPILRRGTVETVYSDEHSIVFLRRYEQKTALIALNNSDSPVKITVEREPSWQSAGYIDPLDVSEPVKPVDGKLEITIPATYGKVLLEQ